MSPKTLLKLRYLFPAHLLVVLYNCNTFHKNISKDFRGIEQTRFVTDRRTFNYRKNNRPHSVEGDILQEDRWSCCSPESSHPQQSRVGNCIICSNFKSTLISFIPVLVISNFYDDSIKQ